ncbi:collagen alpha-1(I) chain-like [Passer montanus]|uniref:collagen alpha-1(I) chain-like n=1 Tax=Passer montanus TaxID=9160 RepID=UPI001960AB59|nr:collagen alpha-1(I) chain-like [Passer montanus]XP_039566410.1 collagen alpha-1(I) chain-like [Passer montanus]
MSGASAAAGGPRGWGKGRRGPEGPGGDTKRARGREDMGEGHGGLHGIGASRVDGEEMGVSGDAGAPGKSRRTEALRGHREGAAGPAAGLPPPRPVRTGAPKPRPGAPCRRSPARQRDSPSDRARVRAPPPAAPARPAAPPTPARTSCVSPTSCQLSFSQERSPPSPRPPRPTPAPAAPPLPAGVPPRYPPSIPSAWCRNPGPRRGAGSSGEGRCVGEEPFVLVPTTKSGFRSQKWGHSWCPIPDPTGTETNTGSQQPCPPPVLTQV